MKKKNNLSLVILAGGEGTRLKKILGNKQKCIAKIDNKPFLDNILNQYSKYIFDKIYILVGKGSDEVVSLYHGKELNFIKIECLVEKKLLGTGGALFKLRNKVKNFILVNGDSLLDIDINKFLKFEKKFICKMSLVNNQNYLSNTKLSNLNLKKNIVTINSSLKRYMNGGVYFFNYKIFKYIKNKKMSLEQEILPNLIKNKNVIGQIYKHNFFFDIGTKKNFIKSKKILKNHLSRPAIFMDRDGVINHDYGYVSNFDNFRFRNGVVKGLDYLIKKKYYLFIITNQAGIAKNIFSINQFKKLQIKVKECLAKKNIFIDTVVFCPHHIDGKVKLFTKNCKYRKPQNGMIQKILKHWYIDIKKSFFIGDQVTDKLCANKSKLKFFYSDKNFYYQVKKIHTNYIKNNIYEKK